MIKVYDIEELRDALKHLISTTEGYINTVESSDSENVNRISYLNGQKDDYLALLTALNKHFLI